MSTRAVAALAAVATATLWMPAPVSARPAPIGSPASLGLLDESAAMARALVSGEPVEVSALTTELTRVVADPTTRAFRAEVSALPARVRDPRGGWRAVDTTLVSRSDGTVAPRAVPTDMAFSGG